MADNMRAFGDLNEIRSGVGSEIGVSAWIGATPDRIDLFAEATYDEQWIHVDEDEERPKGCFAKLIALSPTGSPIVPRAGRFSR